MGIYILLFFWLNTIILNTRAVSILGEENSSRRRVVYYTASMSVYPDYEGNLKITGSVVVEEESANSTTLIIMYALSNLETSAVGGMHIHTGTTCAIADLVGGHYYNDSLAIDPWTTVWSSDSSGDASGVLNVTADTFITDNYGRAFVVHDSSGTRAACGLIGSAEYVASLSDYPDYDGSYSITGTVSVSETLNGEVLVNYHLLGLETSTTGGMHIHTGTTCLVADWVGGHYYDAVTDPWTTTWTSDNLGESSGYFILDSGLNSVDDNLGHAYVVHESGGSRAACGLIGKIDEYLVTLNVYPGYEGLYDSIGGYIVVAGNASDSSLLTVTYDLWGMESDETGGMHIHEGTSCVVDDLVGGHYYDLDTDPWTTTWTTGNGGNTSSSYTIDSNISITNNFGHAYVIHESGGTRAACGLIGAEEITADFSLYPEYEGSYIITGVVAVSETLSEMLLVNYFLSGLESNSAGGIHIHTGTTCAVADMVSGHYYSETNDPWTTTWSSNVTGLSLGYFTIKTGYDTVVENLGHAVVVHESGGTRAACGLLGNGREYMATITAYPDYSGNTIITGYVVVAEEYENSEMLRISYSLSGMEASTTGGMHIHTGTTCSSADLVGGHFYDTESLNSDPWTTEWSSDNIGDGYGQITIDSGYLLDQNYGHSFVVHLSSNSGSTRAACGLIGTSEYVTTFSAYPGYTGSVSISGTFAVSVDINSLLLVNYDLEGLETSTSGGIHIHTGTTCAVADMVQGHYYNSTVTEGIDPWTTTWSSTVDGNANGYFTMDDGYNTIANNLGHAVVVHESDGTRAACGIVGNSEEYLAIMAPYPDYDGGYSITGYIAVSSEYEGAMKLRLTCDLSGLEVSTSGGVHIHSGTTCAAANEVGGHYYNTNETNGIDPWITEWESDSEGSSTTMFLINSGYALEDNLDHAVVVHDSSGTRIACGTLKLLETIPSSGSDSPIPLFPIIFPIVVVLIIGLGVFKKYHSPHHERRQTWRL